MAANGAHHTGSTRLAFSRTSGSPVCSLYLVNHLYRVYSHRKHHSEPRGIANPIQNCKPRIQPLEPVCLVFTPYVCISARHSERQTARSNLPTSLVNSHADSISPGEQGSGLCLAHTHSKRSHRRHHEASMQSHYHHHYAHSWLGEQLATRIYTHASIAKTTQPT